ncbi:MAG TPA: polysaccharide biosynthesis/export family protein [Longimicrobium sp.]|jgi:polysaccharide export outer membrane protein
MKYVLAFLALMGASPLFAQQAQPADGPTLRPGDAVQITVWRKPEFSGDFNIALNGRVDHPLYQDVEVAGVPMSVARERLREYLKTWEVDPRFVVKPLFRVAVGGQVQRPSLYALPPEMTIAQAVATAGGVTPQGRLNRVRVLRASGDLMVDLTRSEGPGARETVRSGDQIIVEQRGGEVFRQYIAPAGALASAVVTLVALLVRN